MSLFLDIHLSRRSIQLYKRSCFLGRVASESTWSFNVRSRAAGYLRSVADYAAATSRSLADVAGQPGPRMSSFVQEHGGENTHEVSEADKSGEQPQEQHRKEADVQTNVAGLHVEELKRSVTELRELNRRAKLHIARKAQELQEVHEDLKELETEQFEHWARLKKGPKHEAQYAMEQLRTLSRQLGTVTLQKDRAAQRIVEIVQKFQPLQEKIMQLQRAIDEPRLEAAAHAKRVSELRHALQHENQEKSKATQCAKELQQTLKDDINWLATLLKDAQILADEVKQDVLLADQLAAKCGAAKATLNKAECEMQLLESEGTNMQEALYYLEVEKNSEEHELHKLKAELQEHKERLVQKQQELDDANKKLQPLQTQLESAHKAIQTKTEAVIRLQHNHQLQTGIPDNLQGPSRMPSAAAQKAAGNAGNF